MRIEMRPAARFVLCASAACIGLFASYIAYLVVPEIVRVVVPAVVQSVVGS
ncbi:MAG TPA: hypothetical protein VHZ28_06435 [Terracidiphilus sp.]|jgi:hypothetical protein|nr:hypothetical protein [Terracidiphilus sp.]